MVVPRTRRLPARKLWIAFAVGSAGIVVVDEGQAGAAGAGVSLLPAGVTGVKGSFEADEASRSRGRTGVVFAKARCAASTPPACVEVAGRRTFELLEGITHEVVPG